MAAENEVTTNLNIDITQFKKGLSEANRYIRTANSEFDKATAGMEKWSDSADGLQAKIAQLTKTLSAQEDAAQILRHEYERVCQEEGEASVGAQELAIRLNKQEAACEKTRAQIKKYGAALDDMGDESDEASDEISQLDKSLDKAGDSVKDAARDSDDLSDSMSKLPDVAKKASEGFTVMKGALASLVADGIRAAIDGLKDLVTGGIDFYKSMEGYKTSFKVMTGSAKKAGEVTKELGAIAAKTPFELTDLADTTQLLMNYGLTADDAMGKMQMLGDISQGSADKMSSIATAYGQMSSAGKVSLEDIKQMIEAGFNPLQEISQTTGESMSSLYDRISKGKISVDEITASMERSTSAGGKYFQSMEKQSQTLEGRLSTLKDAINSGMGTALENVLGNISDNVLPKLTSALDGIDWEGIGDGVNKMIDPFIKLVSGDLDIGGFFTAIITTISDAVPQVAQKAGEMLVSFTDGLNAGLPVLLDLGKKLVSQVLTGIVSNLPSMVQGSIDTIGGFVDGLKANLPVVLDKGAELLDKLGEGIRTALPGLVDQALDVIMNFVTTLYDNAPKLIETGFDLLSDLVQGIMDALPSLIAKGPEIISKFANIINDNFPKILAKGVQLIGQIIMGIIQAIPTLIANIPKVITAIVDVWEAFNWINLGKKAITFLKDGITSMVGSIKSAGKNVFDAIMNAIKSLPSELAGLAKNGMTSLKTGITSMGSSIKSASTNILNGIVSIFKTLPSKMVGIGKDAINGVIDGIAAMVGKLYDSIKNALSGLVEKGKKALGIASPSKVLADEIGKWIPAGIGEGIVKNTKSAVKAMTKSTKSILGAANSELAGTTLTAPGVSTTGAVGVGSTGGITYNFYQTNNSPKALSRFEIYRQTNNQLKFATANT